MTTDTNLQDESLVESLSDPFYLKWFINDSGHIRALWRIALFASLTFGLGAVIGMITDLIPVPDEGKVIISWAQFLGRGGKVIAMILAAYIMLRWVDKRPFNMLGLSLHSPWKRDFFLGLMGGIALLSITLAVLWGGGWVSLSPNELTPALLAGLSKAALLFTVAALMEELLLRGYPFQAFIEGSRFWIATVVLSSIFSLLHMDNPNATIPSAVNIFLAGVLFSVCYVKTRSLWFPTGLHIGWNWMQASFWGMGVSGFHVKWSIFKAIPSGADWISGGKFGAEASVFATIFITLAIVAIWKTDRFSVSPALEKAWNNNSNWKFHDGKIQDVTQST